MKTNHTPGPWLLAECGGLDGEIVFHTIDDFDGNHLASTWAGPHIANARLITAAPELLSLLDEVRARFVVYHEQGDFDIGDLMPEIEKTITKATSND